MGNRIQKVSRFIFDSNYRFDILSNIGLYNSMEDQQYLEKKYYACLGKKLNLSNPQTFNEKLQWLKLYDRKNEYVMMVDKYNVRKYISEKIGEDYLVPLLGVWDKAQEIDFELLPEKYVLKCTHNSGTGMFIKKQKGQYVDQRFVIKQLNKGLHEDYYKKTREWPYKMVVPRIIAEQYLEDDSGGLRDYKIHCFNGVPKLILVCGERFTQEGAYENFYTTDWERLDLKRPNVRSTDQTIPNPKELNEMLEISRILSKDITFLRVDFYLANQRIYLGELTFFPASGMKEFIPDNWDNIMGTWLRLPIEGEGK